MREAGRERERERERGGGGGRGGRRSNTDKEGWREIDRQTYRESGGQMLFKLSYFSSAQQVAWKR